MGEIRTWMIVIEFTKGIFLRIPDYGAGEYYRYRSRGPKYIHEHDQQGFSMRVAKLVRILVACTLAAGLSVAAVAVLSVSRAHAAAPPPNVAGTWNVQESYGSGDDVTSWSGTFVLQQQGADVFGTATETPTNSATGVVTQRTSNLVVSKISGKRHWQVAIAWSSPSSTGATTQAVELYRVSLDVSHGNGTGFTGATVVKDSKNISDGAAKGQVVD